METETVRHEITAEIKPVDNDERTDLQTLALNLPVTIRDLRLKMIKIQQQILDNDRSLKRLTAEIMNDIQDTTGMDGKPVFSNDAKRKAELTTRLSSDQVAINLQTELDTLNLISRELEVEIEFNNNRFKAVRKVIDLVTSSD